MQDLTPLTRVSVPGKVILMGEHAVVYGRPAIVTAVDLRLSAALAGEDAEAVRLELPGFDRADTFGWASVVDRARDARRRWARFAARPCRESFDALRDDDPAHFVCVALGEAAAHRGDTTTGPAVVRIDSEIPVGAGFGSSAAAAVALVAGYQAHGGGGIDLHEVDRLAFEVERRQHGLPSGVDHTTVLRGGVLWAVRRADGTLRTAPLPPPPAWFLERLRVADTGPPAECTGDVVAAVHDRLEGLGREGGDTLDRMERATRRLREILSEANAGPDAPLEPIREYQRCLERLGAVPDPVARVVRRIEARGGAAKISGAGALTGSAAGGLLVYHPQPGAAEGLDLPAGSGPRAIRLGAPGLREESAR